LRSIKARTNTSLADQVINGVFNENSCQFRHQEKEG